MITKQDLVKLASKEFATTLKMLRAYPADKGAFKPDEKSRSAIDIAKTFVFELYLFEAYVFGDALDRSKFKTYGPESMKTVADDFEKNSSAVLQRLEKLSDSDLNKTLEFAGRQYQADEFCHMMILDQVHHRGQLSIYVRLAGGKIPSVYGPSADDSSTNL